MFKRNTKLKIILSFRREMKIKYLIFVFMKWIKLMKRIKRMENLGGVPFVGKELIITANPRDFQSVVMNVSRLTCSNHDN